MNEDVKVDRIKVKIADFLTTLDQVALVYKEAINKYIKGDKFGFRENMNQIINLERRADKIQSEIENEAVLVSSSRNKNLPILIDKLDDVVDLIKKNIVEFDVEKPCFYEDLRIDMLTMADITSVTINSLIDLFKRYYLFCRDVKGAVFNVVQGERNSDKISIQLKRKVFNNSEITFSHKMHLKYFIEGIDNISDVAKNIADSISFIQIQPN